MDGTTVGPNQKKTFYIDTLKHPVFTKDSHGS